MLAGYNVFVDHVSFVLAASSHLESFVLAGFPVFAHPLSCVLAWILGLVRPVSFLFAGMTVFVNHVLVLCLQRPLCLSIL